MFNNDSLPLANYIGRFVGFFEISLNKPAEPSHLSTSYPLKAK
jgi:hypothetical protein